MKRGILLIIIIVFVLFISSCKEEISEPQLSPSDECGQPVPGILNVKFREGYDLSTQEKAIQLVSDIQKKERVSEKVETSREEVTKSPQKVEKLFTDSKKEENKAIQKKIGLDRWIRITVPLDSDIKEELAKWSAKPEVEKVDLEYYPCLLVTPNDNRFRSQWYHENTGDNFGTGIVYDADMDTPEAWDTQTGERILIATPDTSIFWNHEDLIDNIWQNLGEDADGDGKVIQPNGTDYIYAFYDNFPNPGENRTINRSYIKHIFDPDDINGIDDDGNGYVDDFIGWDFASNDNDPIYESTDSLEYQWHGSQTAGCAAAVANNSVGLAGSCWNCELMAMRRGNSNPYAIEYAIENGAKVISMSWISYYTGWMAELLDYAHELDIILFAGAGNFASDNGGMYNGLCRSENVICIAGSTAFNNAWGDSSYIFESGKHSDFGAPSASIISVTPYNHPLSKYVWSSGTSLGSPMAAGIAALMLSENPNLTADEVKSIMLSSLDLYGSVPTNRYAGNGMVNANKSLAKAINARNYGSFPVSIIDESNSYYVANLYNIVGKASSPDFVKYEIYHSLGHYSNEWTLLNTSYSPVNDGILYTMDTSQFPIGEGQIRVIVYDSNNQNAVDATPYVIEEHPPIINQSVELSEGWNLFSLNVSTATFTSENIGTFLVAGYSSKTWKVDLASRNNDSFILEPWQGYYAYSGENKSLEIEGIAPDTSYPTMDWTSWSLVSFNESKPFSEIYFEHPYIRIFNLSIIDNTPMAQEITQYDNLTKGDLYWILLGQIG